MIEHAILSYVNIRYFSRETFGLNYHRAPEDFKNKEMELNININRGDIFLLCSRAIDIA